MVRRFISLVLASTLTLVYTLPADAIAQDQNRAREAAKVREKIVSRGTGPRATVEVQLRGGTRLFGIIHEAGVERFTLIEIPTHRSIDIAYSDVKKVRSNLKAALNRQVFLTAFSVFAGLLLLGKVAR